MAPEDPESGARQRRVLARRLHDCLGLAELQEDEISSCAGDGQPTRPSLAGLLGDLEQVMSPADGGGDGQLGLWMRSIEHLWSQEAWREQLDREPGLRTALRLALPHGTVGMVSAHLANRLARSHEIALICLARGCLWISEDRWLELTYHWEFGARGVATGSPAQRFASEPQDLSQLRRAFDTALCGPAHREYLMHVRYLGGLPAAGYDLAAAGAGTGVAGLVASVRRLPYQGACLIAESPQLFPWFANGAALPDQGPSAAGVRASREAWQRYSLARRQEPIQALRQLLCACGGGDPHAALVQACVRMIHLRCDGDAGSMGAGCWLIPFPQQAWLPPLRLMRSCDELLVESEGLAALLVFLGWFPPRYLEHQRRESWSFSTLEACGWSLLRTAGWWTLRCLPGAGVWIGLPSQGSPAMLPLLATPPPRWHGPPPGKSQLALPRAPTGASERR